MSDCCLRPVSRLRTGCAPPAKALVLVCLVLALTAQSAAAGVKWCRSDPVLLIDGNLADVFVSIPLDDLLTVTGPTKFVITKPVGVSATLLVAGVGFGYGEEVWFEDSPSLKVTSKGIQLRIRVRVPARDAIPVLVEFAPRVVGILAPDSAEGTANEWIPLRSAA